MPKIIQLKEINGSIWARLDMDDYINKNQSVTLYTDNELKNYILKEKMILKEKFEKILSEI